jgi:hypothetical protein
MITAGRQRPAGGKASKMVRILYCWRCQMEIPMLEEHEAAYVLERGPDQEFGPNRDRILRRYLELTGFEEPNSNAVWHHVAGQYGAACSSCGKPLRTPRARMCAACGGRVARPGGTPRLGNPPTPLRPVAHRISWKSAVRLPGAMACHGGKLPQAANCNPMADVVLQGFIVTHDGEIMKAPSVLGLAVEQAIDNDTRFRRDRESVLYGAFFRTLSGTAFLIERTTINHINLWIPETEAARVTAESLGLSVSRSVPWLDPSVYGRLWTLRTVPQLAEQPLYKIPVHRPEQALDVLGALA